MPLSDSQAFRRKLFLRSGDISVAGGGVTVAGNPLISILGDSATVTIGDIMVFGQDPWAWGAHLRRAPRARRVRLPRKQPNQSNPTTWRLAAMNMAIRGIDFDFGKEPADTFTRDQHPDLRADFVMANPPFNIKEWRDGKLEGDARWKYGTPPQGNANFAWVQHMLHHLAPNGCCRSY